LLLIDDQNDVGLELSEMEEVTALTDVTGFGLMGIYLKSVKEAMYLLVNYSKVPVFKEIHDYIDKKCVPGVH
jgi:selenide,water dikinase